MTDTGPVLSDVHVECQSQCGKEYAVTRFKFHLPVSGKKSSSRKKYFSIDNGEDCASDDKEFRLCHSGENVDESRQSEDETELQYDSDGDLIVDRPTQQSHDNICPVRKKLKIEHLSKPVDEKRLGCVQCNINNKNDVEEQSFQINAENSANELSTYDLNEHTSDIKGVCHGSDNTSKQERCTCDCDSCNVTDDESSKSVIDQCQCFNNTEVSPTYAYENKFRCSDLYKVCTWNKEEYFINIKHSLATHLQDVGQQVWHGALLLSDFLIHHADILTDKVVVDLGAGVGLTSIVAAMYAKSLYSTDTGDKVLSLNEANILSAKTCPTLPHPLCQILVKEVDWFQELTVQQTSFGLTLDDINCIKECDILLAADVIYDFDIIDAFFNTIKHIMDHPPCKTLYISLEKRLVFTVEDLAVTSPAYNYFRLLLNDLESETSDSNVKYKVTSHDADFYQYFQYKRSKYLELWSISSKFEDS